MKGFVMCVNPISGPASHRDVASGCMRATAFGASSPRTMCRNVMNMNATVTATVWVAMSENGSGSITNMPSSTEATAGSPIHPSPRLATVMPS